MFLAQDTKLDRPVALKLLPKELAGDDTRRKRFLSEAKTASILNHSNICTIYDAGETSEGQPFIAMEFVEGQGLDQVTRSRRLGLVEIVSIGLQIAEALELARQHGVVHRDIKPGNIMVDAQGRVKVLDFGLAKRLDLAPGASSVTQEGAIVGTPNYLSPELALGREVDSRSDIFSLGIVLYELAAGKNPFAGASFGETVNNILNRDPEPIRPWNPTVTPGFERVVRKCLEKEAANRYATPGQLRDDLAKLQVSLRLPLAQNRTVRAAAGIALGLVLVALVFMWLQRSKAPLPAAKGAKRITSLAVKPLDDFSGSTNDAYLSDSMTEALTAALGDVGALTVRSRSSVMRYKGTQVSIREMARDLGVDGIVEGSVQRSGNRILVTAKLIEAATDRQLWSDRFERDLVDFFDVQSEVARAIAAQVQVRLTPEDQARLRRARTTNPQALEAYLRGRIWSDQSTKEGFTNAVRLFQQAISLDPRYALAYAGLAGAYYEATDWLLPPRVAMTAAKTNAETALRLQETLAQAHVILSYVRNFYEWDREAGRRECERAMALAPNLTDVHRAWGWYYLHLKRFDEARRAFTRAVELDPSSPVLSNDRALLEVRARDYRKGLELAQATEDRFPGTIYGPFRLAWVYEQLGQYDEALAAIAKARTIDDGPDLIARQAHIYASAGQRDKAMQIEGQLRDWQKQGYVSPTYLAWVHLGLGQTNEAIARLEEAAELRCGVLMSINSDPYCDPIRTDPRFIALLRRLGLPE